jgi:hypothetical protein
MVEALFWLAVGLIIGWNVFPQPEWVENLYKVAIQKLEDFFSNSEK